MDIGDKIRVLRLLHDYSQTHLARLIGKKAATHVVRWENGDSMPRAKVLQKLGEALEIHWPWLQDSSLEISKEKVLHYIPMNPITPYTPRWTALMTQQLPQYLPRLLTEINIQAIKCFVAPCGGGIIVAQKDGLALKISCLPVLFSAVVSTLPEHQKINISDLTYLKDSCDQAGNNRRYMMSVGWNILLWMRHRNPPSRNHLRSRSSELKGV